MPRHRGASHPDGKRLTLLKETPSPGPYLQDGGGVGVLPRGSRGRDDPERGVLSVYAGSGTTTTFS